MNAADPLDRYPTFAYLRQLANADGYALAAYANQPVNGCQICGYDQPAHRLGPHQYPTRHPWAEPTNQVRKLRILARRHLAATTARYRAEYQQVMAEILGTQHAP